MHVERSPRKVSCIASSTRRKKEFSKITSDACRCYVMYPHILLEDFQRPLVEWLGFGRPAGVAKEVCEILKINRKVGMIGLKDLFSAFDRLSIEAFRLFHSAIALKHKCEIAKPR